MNDGVLLKPTIVGLCCEGRWCHGDDTRSDLQHLSNNNFRMTNRDTNLKCHDMEEEEEERRTMKHNRSRIFHFPTHLINELSANDKLNLHVTTFPDRVLIEANLLLVLYTIN